MDFNPQPSALDPNGRHGCPAEALQILGSCGDDRGDHLNFKIIDLSGMDANIICDP
jgi:hypothetical protein